MDFKELMQYDSEVYEATARELSRQQHNIELIASENIVSKGVLLAAGTVLTNKYAEGYPAHRYYGGCQYVDEVEELARQRACQLFGAEHANVQPHSGASANLAVFFALLQLTEGYITKMFLDKDDQVCGYEFVHMGKFMDAIKKGVPADEALKSVTGTYGRTKPEQGIVKSIDPRKE